MPKISLRGIIGFILATVIILIVLSFFFFFFVVGLAIVVVVALVTLPTRLLSRRKQSEPQTKPAKKAKIIEAEFEMKGSAKSPNHSEDDQN